MSDLTFALEPFENEAHRGYRGTAGRYGDVMAYYIKSISPNQVKLILRSHLASEHLPEAHLDAIGVNGQPSVYKATLEVDGAPAKLKYNSYGLTRAARALHITYADRKYTYMYTSSTRDDVELRRRGAHVSVKVGRMLRKIGRCRDVSTHGDIDEIDLAIALVLEAVSTDPLAPIAAALYAPDRLSANTSGSD